MYTILIVDDEDEIREGIIKRINWERYGFKIIGQARNGKETIELLEVLRPDIVMTDIIMPFMNGLELGEILYRKAPSTKIIIFSGSDDLEYAHKAIKINVVEYVLKPVNAEDIIATLKKLKILLDEEYDKRRDLEVLREYYTTSLPIIKEQILTSLVDGRLKEADYLKNRGLIGIKDDSYGYVSCLILLENNFTSMQKEIFIEEDKVLRDVTIKQLIDDTLSCNCDFESFFYSDMIALVVNIKDEGYIYKLIDSMKAQIKDINRIYGVTSTVGIGVICENPLDLRYSRKEAQTALDYRFLLGGGEVIYIGDVEPDTSIRFKFNGQDERDLTSVIKTGSEEDIEIVIKEIIDKLSSRVGVIDNYRIYFMEVKVSLLRLIQNYNLSIEEVFEEESFHGDLFEDNNSLEDLKIWLKDKSIKISRAIKSKRKKSSTLLIDRAKDYVNENYYNSNLSVDLICKELHVSDSYFSTVFKKETGHAFISYLRDIRLEKAAELLSTTDDKSYIVAEKVGYSEPNYFSYVFKKKYGIAPSKFRNNKG